MTLREFAEDRLEEIQKQLDKVLTVITKQEAKRDNLVDEYKKLSEALDQELIPEED